MTANKVKFIEMMRMFTAPLCFLVSVLVSVLTWIYLTDRTDNKEFQNSISAEIRQGFREISSEFKSIRSEAAITKTNVEAKLGFISGACCSETRDRRSFTTSDSINY